MPLPAEPTPSTNLRTLGAGIAKSELAPPNSPSTPYWFAPGSLCREASSSFSHSPISLVPPSFQFHV